MRDSTRRKLRQQAVDPEETKLSPDTVVEVELDEGGIVMSELTNFQPHEGDAFTVQSREWIAAEEGSYVDPTEAV